MISIIDRIKKEQVTFLEVCINKNTEIHEMSFIEQGVCFLTFIDENDFNYLKSKVKFELIKNKKVIMYKYQLTEDIYRLLIDFLSLKFPNESWNVRLDSEFNVSKVSLFYGGNEIQIIVKKTYGLFDLFFMENESFWGSVKNEIKDIDFSVLESELLKVLGDSTTE